MTHRQTGAAKTLRPVQDKVLFRMPSANKKCKLCILNIHMCLDVCGYLKESERKAWEGKESGGTKLPSPPGHRHLPHWGMLTIGISEC